MRSRAAAALVCLAAVLPAAGCYQAAGKTVSNQAPSGNGTDFHVGDLLVQDTTIVAGAAGARGSMLFTVINKGTADDALTSVQTDPATTSSLRGPLALPAGTAVKVGAGSPTTLTLTGLEVPAGSYATVRFTFRRAGTSTQQVLVVPEAGYYQGYGPAPATPRASGSPKR